MVKQLGSLTLPGSMEWLDRPLPTVRQEVLSTVGGGVVVYSSAGLLGQAITLRAREQICWLSQSEVDALSAMAGIPGARYLLTWPVDGDPVNDDTYTVMFRHQEDPALEFKPVFPHGTNWFATIKLMTA